MMATIFFVYGIALWFGGWLIQNNVVTPFTGKVYTGGDIITIFIVNINGATALGQVTPLIRAMAEGTVAGAAIFAVIDRKSKQDYYSDHGIKPKDITGKITFSNINFSYSSRKEMLVLEKLSFGVSPGQKIALGGPSGSGKSTVASLLERFYSPTEGNIYLDSFDLEDLNLKWWRESVSIVNQEPVLFNGTIRENILFGRLNATEKEVIEAAKMANAHKFIVKLQDGYETNTGDGGTFLSGGQKQRIAIARAIIKDPKLLILDEATSALDTRAEKTVQAALEKVMKGRTTLIIAHRLSTIKNSDLIFVMKNGKIVEKGNHKELIQKRGEYSSLVKFQTNMKLTETSAEKQQYGKISVASQNSKKESFKIGHNVSKQKKGKIPKVSLWRLIKMSEHEKYYIMAGMLTATLSGMTFPMLAIFVTNILETYSKIDKSSIEKDSLVYLGAFFALGIINFLSDLGSGYFYGYSGETLTKKLREMSFHSVVSKKMEWFDQEVNDQSKLSDLLETETTKVNDVTVGILPSIVSAISTLVTGIIISLISSYKLGLAVLASTPLLIIAGALSMLASSSIEKSSEKAIKNSNKLSKEVFDNIRTVAAFAAENSFVERYEKCYEEHSSRFFKKSVIAALPFGLVELIYYFINALAFYYGSKLIQSGQISFTQMLSSAFGAILGVSGFRYAIEFSPDIKEARIAKDKIFHVIDDDNDEIKGGYEVEDILKDGKFDIEFKEVDFFYPARQKEKVLDNFSFKLKQNTSISVVGSSGSGKSTIVSLMLGFYKPNKGELYLNDVPYKDINIHSLRESIGLVLQEPTLFNGSIKENIRFGKLDASDEEIIEAAKVLKIIYFYYQKIKNVTTKKANIHNDILSFPNQYETNCGIGGTKLSGGQKQRVAIARALIKKPRVLLFDEATSALDTESEKIVQDAINSLIEEKNAQRSTLSISHRLSAVKFSNFILVLSKGTKDEFGTYSDLIEKKGSFYKLLRAGNE
ncbi:ABC transporter B member 11 [Bonamia ostreae]|uniref:ABC transporter B member 11 n=1 Tax=Bonamia ostreae TaxID=126728 RepID=A0ABV2AFT6_9EUKA